MRGGSSINNMLNGDAEKAVLTMATLKSGSADEKQRRARDIYLLAVNPYFLMRTIVLMLGDALLEMFQYTKACLRNGQPRMNRLHKGYPLLQAACTVFMRDVAAYMRFRRCSPALRSRSSRWHLRWAWRREDERLTPVLNGTQRHGEHGDFQNSVPPWFYTGLICVASDAFTELRISV
jgi:hypothetical protein